MEPLGCLCKRSDIKPENLLFERIPIIPSKHPIQRQYDEEKEDEGEDAPVGEETAQAMLASVEEMLEGYELARGDLLGTTGRGTTGQIEARLLDELMALEKVMATHWVPLLRSFRSRYQANIHSFIESDDRVNIVLKFLEDAIQRRS